MKTNQTCENCNEKQCRECKLWLEDKVYPGLLNYDATSFYDNLNHDQRQSLRKEGY